MVYGLYEAKRLLAIYPEALQSLEEIRVFPDHHQPAAMGSISATFRRPTGPNRLSFGTQAMPSFVQLATLRRARLNIITKADSGSDARDLGVGGFYAVTCPVTMVFTDPAQLTSLLPRYDRNTIVAGPASTGQPLNAGSLILVYRRPRHAIGKLDLPLIDR